MPATQVGKSASEQRRFTAAVIQLCSGREIDANIEAASSLIREAAMAGATYIQTPEVTNLIEMKSGPLFEKAEPPDDNRAVRAFAALASELGIWLHVGSMVVRLSDEKVANRAFVFDPHGRTVATYDKIHMFDVALPGGETYRESKRYQRGDKAVAVDLPWARLGVTICYDLRFPALYGDLVKAGCEIIAIPSAFTVPTGRAHWHVLLRARAIETQCFVIAAAQGGEHESGRKTFGHSLIVSPWGDVVAEVDTDAPGFALAEIDMAAVNQARERIPAHDHHVPFTTDTSYLT
ncbi:MAG: carbon-nitrogen hydrolase family protein [Pseudomonadota bacterium]